MVDPFPCTMFQTIDTTASSVKLAVTHYFVRKDRMPDSLWGIMHTLNGNLVTGGLIESLLEVLESGTIPPNTWVACRTPGPGQHPLQGTRVVDLVTVLTRGPTSRGYDLELGMGACTGMSEEQVRSIHRHLATIILRERRKASTL